MKTPGTSNRLARLQQDYAVEWEAVLAELSQPWERYLARSCISHVQWRQHVWELDADVRAVLQTLYKTQAVNTHTLSLETMAAVLAEILEADLPRKLTADAAAVFKRACCRSTASPLGSS